MPNYAASIDRDANRQTLNGVLPFLARKTRTYTGAAGLGATGATTLFTVTGSVLVRVLGCCTVTIVGAGTLEVGIPGNTASLLAQIANATNLAAGQSYLDATPSTVEAVTMTSPFVIAGGQDVTETIGTTALTAGSVDFYCFWRPLSADGNVVAA